MSLMSKTDFRKVWYAVLPLFVSYLPLGLASGILLQSVHFNVFQTFLISVLVFSGGGQFRGKHHAERFRRYQGEPAFYGELCQLQQDAQSQ